MDFDYKDSDGSGSRIMDFDKMSRRMFAKNEDTEVHSYDNLAYRSLCTDFSESYNNQDIDKCCFVLDNIQNAIKHDNKVDLIFISELPFLPQIFEILAWEIVPTNVPVHNLIKLSIKTMIEVVKKATTSFAKFLINQNICDPLISIMIQKDDETIILCIECLNEIVKKVSEVIPIFLNKLPPDLLEEILFNEEQKYSLKTVTGVALFVYYMLNNGKLVFDANITSEEEEQGELLESDEYSDYEEEILSDSGEYDAEAEAKEREVIPIKRMEANEENLVIIQTYFELCNKIIDAGFPDLRDVSSINDNYIIIGFQLLTALFHRDSDNWKEPLVELFYNSDIENKALILLNYPKAYIKTIIVNFIYNVFQQDVVFKFLNIGFIVDLLGYSEENAPEDQEFGSTNQLSLRAIRLLKIMLDKNYQTPKKLVECEFPAKVVSALETASYTKKRELLSLYVHFINKTTQVPYILKEVQNDRCSLLFEALQVDKDAIRTKYAIVAISNVIDRVQISDSNIFIDTLTEDDKEVLEDVISYFEDNDSRDAKSVVKSTYKLIDKIDKAVAGDDYSDSSDSGPVFGF